MSSIKDRIAMFSNGTSSNPPAPGPSPTAAAAARPTSFRGAGGAGVRSMQGSHLTQPGTDVQSSNGIEPPAVVSIITSNPTVSASAISQAASNTIISPVNDTSNINTISSSSSALDTNTATANFPSSPSNIHPLSTPSPSSLASSLSSSLPLSVFKGVAGAGVRSMQGSHLTRPGTDAKDNGDVEHPALSSGNSNNSNEMQSILVPLSESVSHSTNMSSTSPSGDLFPTSDKAPASAPTGRHVSMKLKGLIGGLNLNADQLMGMGPPGAKPLPRSTLTSSVPLNVSSTAASPEGQSASGGGVDTAAAVTAAPELKHLSLERPKISNSNRRSAVKGGHKMDFGVDDLVVIGGSSHSNSSNSNSNNDNKDKDAI